MKTIFFLILCCASGSYGETDEPESRHVNFKVSTSRNKDKILCSAIPKKIFIKEGGVLTLEPHLPNSHKLSRAWCDVCRENGTMKRVDDEWLGNKTHATLKKDITDNDFGNWTCHILFNANTQEDLPTCADGFSCALCNVTVEKELPHDDPKPMEMKTIYTIAIVVGVLVLLVIIGQAIALCYFRRKVSPQRRMDRLAKRSRTDRSDEARYSSPPCRKNSKSAARAQADTDSHIYEMVGINALYNGSHQFSMETKTDAAENTNKGRPQLPLPHEMPAPAPPIDTLPRRKPSPLQSMPSTLNLNSTSTRNKKGKEPPVAAKKAPARPPKQVEDLPPSLKRAPKVSPASKTGSIPKMHATDPTMIELKNAMRLRNIATGSPSSPNSTLDRKPKVQIKPNKKPQIQEDHAQNLIVQKPPPGGINPLTTNQPNQIKLIMPKIEASLKQTLPKPAPVPKPIQDSVKPNPVPLPKKPMSHMNPKPTPMSHVPPPQNIPLPGPAPVSHKTPASCMNPVSPATSQIPPHILNRPLPRPQETTPTSHMNPMSQMPSPQHRPLPAPEPVSHMHPAMSQAPSVLKSTLPPPPEAQMTSRPLPPYPDTQLYNEPQADLMHDSDEDEEWTYEPLEQYNIYNI